ncbi:hypothetical protein SLS56_010325 [Neofusicoccum ribis]|uniref:RTA1 domain protein n=1 Tax=Neofusicoccum ribis TaxID=45134 RepID=A0ABR3SEU8_9PEZI
MDSMRSGCVANNPDIDTSYGYVPSEAAGITFIALFGVTTLLHLGQSIWSRQWWTLLFALGGLTEVIGWIGRTWSASCPYNNDAFLMQITTLIIAPTFWTAALYIILGRLIALSGPHTSPLTPRTYLIIFCTCDIVSLVLQAIGGGMASVASSANPPEDTATGTNIMVAGIVFQMAAITVFCALFVVFIQRVRRAEKTGQGVALSRGTKILIAATSTCIIFIYVRSIYRTIELLQGWDGYLITHEPYFIVLDGAMMVAAAAVFNAVHPARFLRADADGARSGKEVELGMVGGPFSTAPTVVEGEGEDMGGGKRGSAAGSVAV